MTTIEDKYADYLFFTAKVFRVLAWVYSVVAIANVVNAVSKYNQISSQLSQYDQLRNILVSSNNDIWSVVMTLVSSALVVFFLYTFSKVLDFLGELAVWVTDLWKRTEAVRRRVDDKKSISS